MKMLSRILIGIVVGIKNIPHYTVKKTRIWKYKLLSTAKHVQGNACLHQPVLFLGLGRIIIGNNVKLGYRPSPYLYSGYIHIEARNPHSVISIGDHCSINNNCTLVSEGTGIEIGPHCLVGTNVEMYDSDFHEIDHKERKKGGTQSMAPVLVGANVFIGSNVRILKGVIIGDNSVIANSSVVVSSIPANVIAAGNPARVIKTLQEPI